MRTHQAHGLRHETKSSVRTRGRVEREHKAFAVRELKAIDDNAGTFEGYVAVFSNRDGNGDVVDRGAFTKTLREAHEVKARQHSQFLFPLLWQHKEDEPIGGFTEAYEDEHGLYVRGQYDLDTELGRRAYSGAKKGYLRGLSIGYDTVKAVFQDRARHLTEVRMWEGSPVTFPANDLAQVTSVKAFNSNESIATATNSETGGAVSDAATQDTSTPPVPSSEHSAKGGDGPTETQTQQNVRAMKQLGGLQLLTQAAVSLDCGADSSEGIVEMLANACGMSLDGDETAPKIQTQVAALMAGIDGLEDAVKAVISAYQEWDAQTDALLVVLGIPDEDDAYAPSYMQVLHSALELKAGRQLSSGNRKRLAAVADGLSGHVDEIKSILKENDKAGKVDENAQDVDIDQEIAAGKKVSSGTKGVKPGRSTTSLDRDGEPDADASTLQELEATLALQSIDLLSVVSE